ncbi:unnamed protein product [Penicillium nalgiovense]|uniref:Uncharacterized protein n=1 Tax=Penicillium salamii TaxID=1612424 RepID=A0A9W4JTI1_9EURO|nr:unnamed protein product [Penicillium nalgiovense]CAG8409566.1 unnamed protein product [Penicillium salamii]CAG8033476.1 unnamed protein product [Penicillium nalgiovense]CAG8036140.1 unnamed protein product [Penicillium nalgiovense]CAG8414260.1 unnamed protein product [Penicillium salamii]
MIRWHNHRTQGRSDIHREKTKKITNTAQIPVSTPGALTAEFMELLRQNETLTTPALKLLDLHFCLWECYVAKTAEKWRLEHEQRQLQEPNEWLANNSDILLQLCDEQALVLRDRRQPVQIRYNGVQASDA